MWYASPRDGARCRIARFDEPQCFIERYSKWVCVQVKLREAVGFCAFKQLLPQQPANALTFPVRVYEKRMHFPFRAVCSAIDINIEAGATAKATVATVTIVNCDPKLPALQAIFADCQLITAGCHKGIVITV